MLCSHPLPSVFHGDEKTNPSNPQVNKVFNCYDGETTYDKKENEMEEFFRNSTAHDGLTKVEVRGVDGLVTFEDSFLDGILDEFPIHALNAALAFRSMIRGAKKWAWVTEDLLKDPSLGEATLWYYHRTLDYDAWEKLEKFSVDFKPYDKGVISLWIEDIWGRENPEEETHYPVTFGLESLPYNLVLAVWP